MTIKTIIAVLAVFIVLSGVTFWIFNSVYQAKNESKNRTKLGFPAFDRTEA